MQEVKNNRVELTKLFLFIIAILALSFLRPMLFVLFPIIVLLFIYLFRLRFSYNLAVLLGLIILTTIASSIYVKEFNLSNYILSYYFIIPILFLYFSSAKLRDYQFNYFEYFIKIVTLILLVNNTIGFIQYFTKPSDDAFMGFYGKSGLGVHTLSLVNLIIGVYYGFKFQNNKSKINLALFLFFLSSSFFCFYGLGLVIFILSVFLYNLTFKNLIKQVIVIVTVTFLLGVFLYFFRRETLLYNYHNLKKIELIFKNNISKDSELDIPRKLILHKNFINIYTNDFGLLFLGSGPGTFNSRTSFLLNGDYSTNKYLTNIFGISNPSYAAEYVYPLWNSKITSLSLYKLGIYNDGTRNQPFSSIVSLLSEYGLFIFVVLFILILNKYKLLIIKINTAQSVFKQEFQIIIYKKYIKFVSIFTILNLFTDNFLEYPEIMILYLIIFKLIEMSINLRLNTIESTNNPSN